MLRGVGERRARFATGNMELIFMYMIERLDSQSRPMGDKIRNKWQDESLESKFDEEENIAPAKTKRKNMLEHVDFG